MKEVTTGATTGEAGSSLVVYLRRLSSKVYVDSRTDSSEGSLSSPKKNAPEEFPTVRKKSFVPPRELELDPGFGDGLSLPLVTRRSSSGFPVSPEDDLSFRVTGRENGSVIYLPQAHAWSLEQANLSSSSVPAAEMTTRPVIARRRSDRETDAQLDNSILRHKSASNLSPPPLPRKGSLRRSIAETQDSFRENMRRRKKSKYVTTYSPREGSRVGQDQLANGGATAAAGGTRCADGVFSKVQLALCKTSKSCCIM